MEASGRGRAGPRSQRAAPGRRPAWLRGLMSGRPPAAAVPAGETVEPPPPPPLHFMYVAVVAFVLLFFVGCGVLLSRKRRRQHGQLWFPEGFKVSEASKKKRREPLGEDSVGLKSVGAAGRLGGAGLAGGGAAPPLLRGAGLGPGHGRGLEGEGISLDPRSPLSRTSPRPRHPQAPEELLGRRPHGRQPERVGRRGPGGQEVPGESGLQGPCPTPPRATA